MSNHANEMVLERIYDDVLDLHKGDIQNIIFAIKNEFGNEYLPNPDDDEDDVIYKLVELRFEARYA